MKLVIPFSALLMITSCGGSQTENNNEESSALSGNIQVDGSSTVYPITEAVAEEFRLENPEVNITIGISGTGGGFKKFGRGEIDITDASRKIKDSEAEECKKNNIEYVEFPIAYDGLAVIVNPQNDWAKDITVQELKKLWEPAAQGTITKWSQVRTGWPDEEIHLYGPGVASGTYDYFTEAVVGESGSSRGDFTASEDDNILVQGVSGDKYALGFFGLSYYEENKDKLKLLGVNNGSGVIVPSKETVSSGTYAPLSRPLYIYASTNALKRSEVYAFIEFYLQNAGVLSEDVGYISLDEAEYANALELLTPYKSANN